MLINEKAKCPVCAEMVWTYRTATAHDQRIGGHTFTGPQYLCAHNCDDDHKPTGF